MPDEVMRADDVMRALRAATGGGDSARPATAADAVAGVPARYVVTPRSTGEVAAVLGAATAHDLAVVARGAGTRQDWAAPPRRVDVVLDTLALTGVVEHAAGDLITVVRAGTPVDTLADRLATAGQQLALDLPDALDLPEALDLPAPAARTSAAGTVGGAVAVGVSGPRRMLYGTVRDLLIGITVVRADGVVARSGGKVVKNVAGYDLGKLLIGSYGTLAVIVECAFRLHPLPAATALVRCRAADAAEAGRLLAAVRGTRVVPSAVEVDAPPDGGIEVAVLIEGVPEGVAARAATIRALLGDSGDTAPHPPGWWSTYPWAPGGVGLKLTSTLSGVPGLLAAARAVRERHGVALTVRGSAGAGVLYAGLPAGTPPDTVARAVTGLRTAAGAAGGHAIVLTAPAEVRERVDAWGPVPGLDLMRRVKHRFDPDARLAPGRFVGGI